MEIYRFFPSHKHEHVKCMTEMYVMEFSMTESSAAQEMPTSTLKVLGISLEKRDRMGKGKRRGTEREGDRESD